MGVENNECIIVTAGDTVIQKIKDWLEENLGRFTLGNYRIELILPLRRFM